jgi:hypothetical protein
MILAPQGVLTPVADYLISSLVVCWFATCGAGRPADLA